MTNWISKTISMFGFKKFIQPYATTFECYQHLRFLKKWGRVQSIKTQIPLTLALSRRGERGLIV